MLYGGKNFRELDHRVSLTEAAMFFANSCMLYDTHIIPLIIVFLMSFKAKNIQAAIKGVLRKLDKLNKSNPFRYMINDSKSKKTKFCCILTP